MLESRGAVARRFAVEADRFVPSLTVPIRLLYSQTDQRHRQVGRTPDFRRERERPLVQFPDRTFNIPSGDFILPPTRNQLCAEADDRSYPCGSGDRPPKGKGDEFAKGLLKTECADLLP